MMIDFPTTAEVHCTDGAAGRSTYVIIDPQDHRLTHLVVQSNRPPFHEYLVPNDKVEITLPNLIKLKCTRKDLYKMEPFECEEYIRTRLPENLNWPHAQAVPGLNTNLVDRAIPVKVRNIPRGEFALRRGARVEATDGYVGQVDELLVNTDNLQVTHLILLERYTLEHRKITIPVSLIDRVFEDKIHLKLDRQGVEELPTTPIQRWLQDEREKAHFENGAFVLLRFSSDHT
jgi:sporulation protein YlmC with PRC-barrel domain